MSTQPLWTVTVAPDRTAEQVAEVAKALRAAGLVVTEVFEEICVINGHGPAALVPKLRRVAGVTDVSQLPGIDIGKPGSDPG